MPRLLMRTLPTALTPHFVYKPLTLMSPPLTMTSRGSCTIPYTLKLKFADHYLIVTAFQQHHSLHHTSTTPHYITKPHHTTLHHHITPHHSTSPHRTTPHYITTSHCTTLHHQTTPHHTTSPNHTATHHTTSPSLH